MSRGRVLVIEGDARVRAELAHGLEHGGAEVIVAADGRDGIARLEAGADPSVVIVDVRRPRLGGSAFVDEVRADPRFEHLPIITMSGGARRRPFEVDDLLGVALSLLPRA
jgi:CheY-like chemotaxis protein